MEFSKTLDGRKSEGEVPIFDRFAGHKKKFPNVKSTWKFSGNAKGIFISAWEVYLPKFLVQSFASGPIIFLSTLW